MSPRPLIRRSPDGTRYVEPSDLPTSRPRYSSGLPAQSASGDTGGPEPTPKPKRRAPAVSAETVREIRADHSTGKWSQADLAYIYDVSQHTVYHVVHGLGRYRKTQPADTQPCVAEQD